MTDRLTDEDLVEIRERAEAVNAVFWEFEGDEASTLYELLEDIPRLLDEVERLRAENQRLSIALDHGQEASDEAFEGLANENANLAMLVLLLRERVKRLGGTVEDIDFRAGGDAETLIAMREENQRFKRASSRHCGHCLKEVDRADAVSIRTIGAPNPFCSMKCAKKRESDDE